MKYKLLKILLLLCGISAKLFAQVSIEKMESVARIVNRLEAKTTDSIYSDGNNKYMLSFPEESFGFDFENGKAWKAVYKSYNGDTYLAITENIDLSKVTGFTWDREYTSRVLMHFPKGTIKTAVSKNGAELYYTNEDYLEFFCIEDMKMLLPLAAICHELKSIQGTIQNTDIEKFELNFSSLMNLPATDVDNSLIKYNEFLKDNESSLFAPIVQEYVRTFNEVKQHWANIEKTRVLCDSLCLAFKYIPKLYIGASLESHNPETKKLLKNKNYVPISDGTGKWYTDFSKTGPCYAEFKKNGLIYYYSFGASPSGTNLYESRMTWLRERIPQSLLETLAPVNGSHYIHIYHTNKEPCISFYSATYNEIPFELIQFSPTEYNKDFHR